jgi:tripartite-type tricarboxylate transporter receptor subunit TctC
MAELTELVKTGPGPYSFAAVGPGSTQQMIGEALRIEAKMPWVYAPYGGGAPAVTALLGNHVTAVIANYSEVAPQVAAGKLRALAVGSKDRVDTMKDVPTLSELGHASVEGTIWFGLVAPAGVPSATVERIQAEVTRAMRTSAVREKLVAQGLYPAEMSVAQWAAFLKTQDEKYRRLIQLTGMKGG